MRSACALGLNGVATGMRYCHVTCSARQLVIITIDQPSDAFVDVPHSAPVAVEIERASNKGGLVHHAPVRSVVLVQVRDLIRTPPEVSPVPTLRILEPIRPRDEMRLPQLSGVHVAMHEALRIDVFRYARVAEVDGHCASKDRVEQLFCEITWLLGVLHCDHELVGPQDAHSLVIEVLIIVNVMWINDRVVVPVPATLSHLACCRGAAPFVRLRQNVEERHPYGCILPVLVPETRDIGLHEGTEGRLLCDSEIFGRLVQIRQRVLAPKQHGQQPKRDVHGHGVPVQLRGRVARRENDVWFETILYAPHLHVPCDHERTTYGHACLLAVAVVENVQLFPRLGQVNAPRPKPLTSELVREMPVRAD
mmetsp:Transcript_75986/g.211048  ORF Transcript_75986/g.211048 Transcript_75986/m.211048 type:complete len:364 (+) Transcript_75986:716-1807(+)